jgi:hypothetical protein
MLVVGEGSVRAVAAQENWNMLSRILVLTVSLAWLAPAFGAVHEITPQDDIRAAVAALEPGDELLLGSGEYALDARFNVRVVGQPGSPIVIRAKPGEDVLIRMTTASQNVIEVQDSEYLVLRNLRFRGGSHGIRLISSNYITIENCEIFETGDVGISANVSGSTYRGLVIRRNHIHHTGGTGEGMYLGCNSDGCRVLDSLIEFNHVHHTNGPNVSQGDGIELKEGSAGNFIRHNVIHDTNYPGILTYGAVGNGPPNVIEGNVIWNSYQHGIQSSADAIIRNNIVIGSRIALQSHQASSPSNQVVAHNTVITEGSGIEVRDVSGPVVVANNAVYSRSGTAIRLISGDIGQVTMAGNIGSGGISGTNTGYSEGNGVEADFVNGHFDGTPPIDLFPAEGGALPAAGSLAYVTEYDFNGSGREGDADVGAYRFQPGGNPGWPIGPGIKYAVGGIALPRPPSDVVVN